MATPVKKPVISTTSKTSKPAQQVAPSIDFAFGKENYRIMLIGIAIIVLGFILMAGGSPKDPTAFSMDIFDFQRITLAPILVTVGFLVEVWAIVKKPKD